MTSARTDTLITEAIRSLTSAVTGVAAAKATHERAAADLLELVAARRIQSETILDPRFLALVRHLYWHHQSLPSWELTAAAGFRTPTELTQAIGPVPSGVFCSACGSELRRTSRSWRPPRAIHGVLLCPDCQRNKIDSWRTQSILQSQRQAFVDSTPVAAPAADWKAAVTLVLAYPPLAVDLDDATSAYVRLWHAYEIAQQVDQDLAGVVPGGEHSVTIRAGTQIVRTALTVIGWDPDRTRDLTEPIANEPAVVVLTRLDHLLRDTAEQRHAQALDKYPDVPPSTPRHE